MDRDTIKGRIADLDAWENAATMFLLILGAIGASAAFGYGLMALNQWLGVGQ